MTQYVSDLLRTLARIYVLFYYPLFKVLLEKIIPILLIIIFVITVSIIFLQDRAGSPYKLFAVTSESMIPTINKGDLILVKSSSTVSVGDIITYKKDFSDIPITHRIVSQSEANGKALYITKGDANESNDNWTVSSAEIIGIYLRKFGGLGSYIEFIRSTPGVIIFMVIPGTAVLSLFANDLFMKIGGIYEKESKKGNRTS